MFCSAAHIILKNQSMVICLALLEDQAGEISKLYANVNNESINFWIPVLGFFYRKKRILKNTLLESTFCMQIFHLILIWLQKHSLIYGIQRYTSFR